MPKDVKLTEEQLRALTVIANSEKRTVDDLAQQAIDDYLKARRKRKQKAFEAGFGLWGAGEDGLAYQIRLRNEW